MSALTQQLEQLNKQKKELEDRIKKEEETKKKLNNEASIERLEALVEPLTTMLNFNGEWDNRTSRACCKRKLLLDEHKRKNEKVVHPFQRSQPTHPSQLKNSILLNEEIYVTLIGILKKQQEQIQRQEERI